MKRDRVFWIIIGILIALAVIYVGSGLYAAKQRNDIRNQPKPGLPNLISSPTP